MDHVIFSENEKKRTDQPIWMLICFSMFCVWQMGFVYFIGPSLTIDGRTPLPVSMDNITTLIAVGYVISILWMIFLPGYVVLTQRIVTLTALASVLGLFLPLSSELFKLLVYVQSFCCCFMIGFETFLIVNYFTENCAIKHMTFAYGVAVLLIAVVQNDIFPITYPLFRVVTVVLLILLLIFFFGVPAKKEACPRYIKKSDGITSPRKLLIGTFVLVFVSGLMAVSGPAISGEVRHGVFITYGVDALASFLIYLLYKFAGVHPFRSISAGIVLGCLGFLLMFVGTYIPAMKYVACVLIGFGMVPCQMLPLYGVVLMKTYPSRFISPITIGLSLVAVLVQSTMVEFFRAMPDMLYLAYGVIMVGLVFIYLYLEPYLMYSLKTKAPAPTADGQSRDEISEAEPEQASGSPLAQLTKREIEVLELIGHGYSNVNIAKMLYISEHTVNDYTKKIYRKLDVHSRHAAAQIINRYTQVK